MLYVPPHLRETNMDGETRNVIKASTFPLASMMRRGPGGDACNCRGVDKHIHALEANMGLGYSGVCFNRNTLFQKRLPRWATGLVKRISWEEIPTIRVLFNVFRRSTWWWKGLSFSKKNKTNNKYFISREARLMLLVSAGYMKGRNEKIMGLSTYDLMDLKCQPGGLTKIRNLILTLDGLCMQLYLAGQDKADVNTFSFFDKVMQSYLRSSVSDMVKTSGSTYYQRLKKAKGKIKMLSLNERLSFDPDATNEDGRLVHPEFKEFWFFRNWIPNLIGRNLSAEAVIQTSLLSQTRAVGLPPPALKTQVLEEHERCVSVKFTPLTHSQRTEVGWAVREMCVNLRTSADYGQLFNRAVFEAKISLSGSASLDFTRESGGKIEAARFILHSWKERSGRFPYYDLGSGQVLYWIEKEQEHLLNPGQKLFHLCCHEIKKLESNADCTTFIGNKLLDCRASVVEEQGKARVITVSNVMHAMFLHPMAHVLSVLIASVPSSASGMKASTHCWNFYKRMGRNEIPSDGIFSEHEGPKKLYFGSEDWSEATDRLNPDLARQMVESIGHELNLPRWYTRWCAILISCPRRIYREGTYKIGGFSTNQLIEPDSCYYKRRGVLMGDPLCKQVLHMTHIVSRLIARDRLKRVCGLAVVNAAQPGIGREWILGPFPAIPSSMVRDRVLFTPNGNRFYTDYLRRRNPYESYNPQGTNIGSQRTAVARHLGLLNRFRGLRNESE